MSSAGVGVHQQGADGVNSGRGSLAARGSYGVNDVH